MMVSRMAHLEKIKPFLKFFFRSPSESYNQSFSVLVYLVGAFLL